MESKVLGYYAIAAILGIIAAATGFAGEATRVKAQDVSIAVATVIAVVLLLSAAVLNNRQGGQVDSYGYITCYVAKPGIFAAGAVLALLSAIFGIAAYIIISSSSPQTVAYPAVALPVGTNVDPEKNPVVFPHQQYAPQRY
ncbi:hypothetical protein R6Q57_023495 [Mikania cordata]